MVTISFTTGTFLELLKALESDLELVGSSEGCRVVKNLDPKQRNNGHDDKM